MIEAKLHVDPATDSAEVIVDLVGTDPFQHEFLKQVFKSELCDNDDEATGTKDAAPHARVLGPEDLRVRFAVKTAGARAAAARVIENRRRAELNLPSVEQEAAMKFAQAKAENDAAAQAAVQAEADKKAQAAGFPTAAAQREHENQMANQTALGEAFGTAAGSAMAKATAPKS
jgi:hypothetical protein